MWPVNDEEYLDTIVQEMLMKDQVWVAAWKNGISQNINYIKDKIVLNMGCGLGMLAIFCAQAGAKKVYAVENGQIASMTRRIVIENNLSDIIVVLDNGVENVELNEKVDVIISEWMGHMLLSESILVSVITARDRWLKPGGIMLPSRATLYMAPFTDDERYRERIDFWHDINGIDMSSVIPSVKECLSAELWVETIRTENILANAQEVASVVCHLVTINELECISNNYRLTSTKGAILNGFAFWFDVEFIGNDLPLSTAPDAPPTCWKQSLLYLREPKELRQDQEIEGAVELSLARLMQLQYLRVDVTYNLDNIRRDAVAWHPKHQPPV